jgi:hypothetical protein
MRLVRLTPAWLRRLAKKEWFLGFIGGVFATLVGFILAVWWDVHKSSRDAQQKHQGAIAAIKDELMANRSVAQHAAMILTAELCTMKQRSTVVQPIPLLRTGAWDLVRLDPPEDLSQRDRLSTLRELYYTSGYLNEGIRHRDAFLLSDAQGQAFWWRLNAMDRQMLTAFYRLECDIRLFIRNWPDLERAAKNDGYVDRPFEVKSLDCDPSPTREMQKDTSAGRDAEQRDTQK